MSSLENKISMIESAIGQLMSRITEEKFWITYYGAFDIDPKHLVYKIVVETDVECGRLMRDTELKPQLRQLLTEHQYPVDARDKVFFGFESDESINRESGGNAWHHWR